MNLFKTYGIIPGVVFKLLNLNLFCLLSIALFYVGGAIPVPLVFLYLNIFVAIALLPVAFFCKITFAVIFRNYKTFILRGIFNAVGICSWVFAMRYIGPNEATAITFIIPILTLILSSIFCDDELHYSIILAIFSCIIGATIVLYPKLNMEFTFLGCLYALISSICWASYDIICKIQSKTEGVFVQSFKNNIYSSIVAIFCIVLLFDIDLFGYWEDIMINLKYLIAAGVISFLNIIVLFCAYRATKVSILMPLGYFRLLFMSVYTYFIFGDVLQVTTVIGGAIIFTTNILIFKVNTKRLVAARKG